MKWHTNRNFLSVRCCSTSLRSWRHCGIGFKVLRLNFPGFRHCKRTRGRGTSMLRQPSREIPWTLEQVRALEEGRELQASDERSQQEVLNHFAGLRFVEKHARKKIIRHNDLFQLNKLLADGVMDQRGIGSLSHGFRASRRIRSAACCRCLRIDVRVAGMVGQRITPAFAGAEFGNPALPFRGDSPVCRWQRPNRTSPCFVGTLPPRIRHAPYFLGR